MSYKFNSLSGKLVKTAQSLAKVRLLKFLTLCSLGETSNCKIKVNLCVILWFVGNQTPERRH